MILSTGDGVRGEVEFSRRVGLSDVSPVLATGGDVAPVDPAEPGVPLSPSPGWRGGKECPCEELSP